MQAERFQEKEAATEMQLLSEKNEYIISDALKLAKVSLQFKAMLTLPSLVQGVLEHPPASSTLTIHKLAGLQSTPACIRPRASGLLRQLGGTTPGTEQERV